MAPAFRFVLYSRQLQTAILQRHPERAAPRRKSIVSSTTYMVACRSGSVPFERTGSTTPSSAWHKSSGIRVRRILATRSIARTTCSSLARTAALCSAMDA